jgi:hypothetical protein
MVAAALGEAPGVLGIDVVNEDTGALHAWVTLDSARLLRGHADWFRWDVVQNDPTEHHAWARSAGVLGGVHVWLLWSEGQPAEVAS